MRDIETLQSGRFIRPPVNTAYGDAPIGMHSGTAAYCRFDSEFGTHKIKVVAIEHIEDVDGELPLRLTNLASV
ncbi:MAG: hypothetical protein R3E58_14605 [Phycisphaerae bacterium]